MSISSSTALNFATSTKAYAPFEQMPNDLFNPIFSYLTGDKKDDWNEDPDATKAIIAIDRVCQRWHSHKNLQTLQRAYEARLVKKYAPSMMAAFSQSNIKLSHLPVLDLSRIQIEASSDFFKPANLNHAVMRFKDTLGRPGFALKIRTDIHSRISSLARQKNYVHERNLFMQISELFLRTVYLPGLFRRSVETFVAVYKDSANTAKWVESKHFAEVVELHKLRQKEESLESNEQVPSELSTIDFLADLLACKDPLFTLSLANNLLIKRSARMKQHLHETAFLITITTSSILLTEPLYTPSELTTLTLCTAAIITFSQFLPYLPLSEEKKTQLRKIALLFMATIHSLLLMIFVCSTPNRLAETVSILTYITLASVLIHCCPTSERRKELLHLGAFFLLACYTYLTVNHNDRLDAIQWYK